MVTRNQLNNLMEQVEQLAQVMDPEPPIKYEVILNLSDDWDEVQRKHQEDCIRAAREGSPLKERAPHIRGATPAFMTGRLARWGCSAPHF